MSPKTTERAVTARALPILTGTDELMLVRTGVGQGYTGSVQRALVNAVMGRWRLTKQQAEHFVDKVLNRHRISWGSPGWPDYSGLWSPGGRAAYVEMKKPGGRLRKEQRTMMETLHGRGAFCAVVAGDDDARAVLRALQKGENRYGWR